MSFTLPLTSASRNVLNKGFIKMVDCMPRVISKEAKKLACDSAIVQAARVSYSQGLKSHKTDTSLINYLYKNKHTSPFEMVKFKFHVKAPIFIARQWFRHRMSNYNEVSGRYTELKEELYEPESIPIQSSINKQLSDTSVDLNNNINVKKIFDEYMKGTKKQYKLYNKLMKHNVSRENARIGLPLNLFTEFYWSIDLHNLLNFLNLRNSSYAQYEIKVYAEAIEDIITPYCPITMTARKNNKTVTFSKDQLQCLDIFEYNFNKLKDREKCEINDILNKKNTI